MVEKMNDETTSSVRPACRWWRMGLFGFMGLLVLFELGLRIYYNIHPQGPFLSPTPDYSYELVGLGYPVRLSERVGWVKLRYDPHLTYRNLPNQSTELFNINELGLRGEPV